MRFVAVDVETANADMASICSIGVVAFEAGVSTTEWYSLVDPRDYFDNMNVSIHGIDEKAVEGQPTYPDIAHTLHEMLRDTVVVTHTHFDRVAVRQASQRWGINEPTCTWLDSARVARRTWIECATRGYGLADVCRLIGHEFEHHNALHDARASGHVLQAAIAKSGIDLEGWLNRVRQPIDPTSSSEGAALRREGNPAGPLFGEVIAFTGALDITRSEAADLAAAIGCCVAPGVTKETTLLVVGDIDIQRLAGKEKSAKHIKAEKMAREGFPIRIIRESDFKGMVALGL